MIAPARSATALSMALLAAASAGCVRRTVTVTSSPSGALVLLNDREIGRTPVTAEITYYGEYDLQLRLEGHEPLDTSAQAKAPAWDWLGPDLVAELIPVEFTSRNAWHFELVPRRDDAASLLGRAKLLQARLAGEEQAAPPTGESSLEELQRQIEAADAVPPERSP